MTLISNGAEDIMRFVGEQLAAPGLFPAFAAADKPAHLRWRYHAIYITDTSKPAWMDASGTWRYADGSTV